MILCYEICLVQYSHFVCLLRSNAIILPVKCFCVTTALHVRNSWDYLMNPALILSDSCNEPNNLENDYFDWLQKHRLHYGVVIMLFMLL